MEEAETGVSIELAIVSRIGLALHQNAVPVVRELVVRQDGVHDLRDVTVELRSTPPVITEKTWRVDRLGAGGRVALWPLDVVLDGARLRGTTESLRATVEVTVRSGGAELVHHRSDVEVLPPDHWGGLGMGPEMLAAWVQPNDPAIGPLVKRAAEILRDHGGAEIDGYRRGRKGAWEIAAALWGAVSSLDLSYAVPPASFEDAGQKVRSPSRVTREGLGTCLDLAVLMAAGLEACGLRPLVVVHEGHAYAGLWLTGEGFAVPVVDDAAAVRKRLQLEEIVVFETTLLTGRPRVSFREGLEQGLRQLLDERIQGGGGPLGVSAPFSFAVDVAGCRQLGIKPLGFDGEESHEPSGTAEDVGLLAAPLFEPAPDFDEEGDEPVDEELHLGPADRLEAWQRRLLDLSLRNRLLNFRLGRKALLLDVPNPGRLEDRLSEGKGFRIQARPTQVVDGREAMPSQKVLDVQGSDAVDSGVLLVGQSPAELERSLVEIYRHTRSTLQETGTNTLYLAFGFLSWTRADRPGRALMAPLVLVPVTLTRKTVRAGFRLAMADDEPFFNPTLLEMLRQDHQLALPSLERELPRDEQGVDLLAIWTDVTQAIKEHRGWEVVQQVVLAPFSFSKHLMWRDLMDHGEHLRKNPVVRHLLETPKDAYSGEVPFPEPRSLDEVQPTSLLCPLPADSSQLAAVLAASRGKDFVLVGPPGTGKSQTITNLIAQCLGKGQSVLFVCEKTAALDVVARRLKDLGLSEFCLEVHSHKARKVDVLAQLKRAWEARSEEPATDLDAVAGRLLTARDQLNRYVQALHRPDPLGLTPFLAAGTSVHEEGQPGVELGWPADFQPSMSALSAIADRIATLGTELSDVSSGPLRMVHQTAWSSEWQERLVAAAENGAARGEAVASAGGRLVAELGLGSVEWTAGNRNACADLAQLLPAAADGDFSFAAGPDREGVVARLASGLAHLRSRDAAVAGLSVEYRREALELPLVELQRDWGNAQASWWPLRLLRAKSVRKRLRVVASGASQDVAGDLAGLLAWAECESLLSTDSTLEDATGGVWRGGQSDCDAVEAALRFSESLDRAVHGLDQNQREVFQRLHGLLGEERHRLVRGASLSTACAAYGEALDHYDRALAVFTSVAMADDAVGASLRDLTPAEATERFRAVLDHRRILHRWCAWSGARAEAIQGGLAPLLTAGDAGAWPWRDAPAVFRRSYARWWARRAVDRDPELRSFVSVEHRRRIEDFRRVDGHFRDLARAAVRQTLARRIPGSDGVKRTSEWGILRREMEKKRRHLPIRQLFAQAPEALGVLAPCLLMSPLSVAQYLAPGGRKFDLVVFDEASQIPVWDAIGAMARARQVVMVGDPKQLPPTRFFERGESDEMAEGEVELEADLESILDECLAANLPTSRLSWHYRSRHESLIAFSNHRYYEGGLVTFPSPLTQDRAVSFHFVDGGVYDKGRSRTNSAEASALVADVVARLKDPVFQASGHTIGIVTFNGEQQRLIEDLLDEERRKHAGVEAPFSEGSLEPLFVKNLESVQGDERDVMYFSITFGPDRQGAISLNFGPMNRDGGERRLNVAVTRARHELRVFSSLRSDQIDLSRTRARGVHDLKHFLAFAERGPSEFVNGVEGLAGSAGSPFEMAVLRALRERGWTVMPEVGASASRVNFGVVHPDDPTRFLLGIEADGETYRRGETARDRDKIREAVLRNLGWEVVRIWVLDWWHDPDGEAEKLHRILEDRLAESRARADQEAISVRDDAYDVESGLPSESGGGPGQPGDAPTPMTAEEDEGAGGPATGVVASAPMGDLPEELGRLDPGAFYEPRYDSVLRGLIHWVVETEAPLRDDTLASRIARMHGWLRTGPRIRDRILTLARVRYPMVEEDGDRFFWPEGFDTAHWPTFRPTVGGEVRPVREVAMAELVALAREVAAAGFAGEDAVAAMARIAGVKKLGALVRQRLERAWNDLTATDG